jgi:hypothetical protein
VVLVLSDAIVPLRALLARLARIDRTRRLVELREALARARAPERQARLRLELLALEDEHRADWRRRRATYQQTAPLRVARLRAPVCSRRGHVRGA